LVLPPGTGEDDDPITLLPPPSPPLRPVPGCAVCVRPLASVVPRPVVPGIASAPDPPVCGAEPAMPDGPPGGPSGAAGRTTCAAFPVPGLPGALGLVSACLLQAPSRAPATNRPASAQAGRAIPLGPYLVAVFAIGVLDDELELMSVGAALPDVPEVVPEAPIEVPLPVVEPVAPVVPPMLEPVPVLEAPAVVSVLLVLGVVPSEPEPELLPVVVLGEELVDGEVVDVDEVADSSFLPQALRDRAAIRARAAHCAIGDLIIRNSLRFRFEVEVTDSVDRCLRLTLVAGHWGGVVCHCRRM
jgi:hypothetical protein